MSVLSKLGRGLLVAVPAGAALVAGAGSLAARRMVAPHRERTKFFTPWELGIPYEDVEFRTADGLKLTGWWLDRPGSARTVVALCGHRGQRSDLLGISSALWRRGMNVLLFDFRGRGTSDPSINTLGARETTDALAAVEYAAARAPVAGVALVGYSMGASVAVLAAARDERVRAVVADSPFASQRRVMRAWFRSRLHLPPIFVRVMELYLPYDVDAVEPIREVGKIAPRACMFIHGELDTLTDPRDSQELWEAAGQPKEMWALPSVAHCGAYFLDRVGYVERVASFLERHVAAQGVASYLDDADAEEMAS